MGLFSRRSSRTARAVSGGVEPRDARAALRDAERRGAAAARKGYPVPAGGDGAADYRKGVHDAEAGAVGWLTLADHAGGQRVADDEVVGELRGATARATALSKHARQEAEHSRTEAVATRKEVPLLARVKFLRGLGRMALPFLGLAAWAAAVGALQNGTNDQGWISYLLGGFAIGGVLVGKSVGGALNRKALANLEDDAAPIGTTRLWLAVVIVGAISALSLGGAVAIVRKTGADAEEARRALLGDIELTLPGAEPDEEPAPALPVVPWGAWFLIELSIGGAAFCVESLAGDPRRALLDEVEDAEAEAIAEWVRKQEDLATTIGRLEAALLARADRDAAVIFANQGNVSFADVLTNTYRDANQVNGAVGGDKWDGPVVTEPGELPVALTELVGVDVTAIAPRRNEPAKDRDALLLAAAYEELTKAPAPPPAELHAAPPSSAPDDVSEALDVPGDGAAAPVSANGRP